MVLLPRLAKADAGIKQDAAKRYAGARREIERALKKALDIVEDVERRILLSRLCMMTTAEPVSATTSAIPGSRCRPQTSLMTQAPSRAASRATFRLARVDGERGVHLSAQRLESGNDPSQLLGLGNRNVAGPRRFAADVDNSRTIGDHLARAGDGCGKLGMASAVGERFGVTLRMPMSWGDVFSALKNASRWM